MKHNQLSISPEPPTPAPWNPSTTAVASSSPSPSSTTAPDVSMMVRALKRRLVPALALGILASAVAGAGAWFTVPQSKYKSEALLQIFATQPKVLFATADMQGASGEDYKRYQRTQAGLVKSRFVLNSALSREGVADCKLLKQTPDPLEWLQKNLEVDFVRESELMSIGLSGESPQELAIVINAVKDAYMEEVVEIEHRRRVERNDVLNSHNKLYTDLLKNRRAALKKLAETVGSDDRQTLAFKQQIAMEHLASVRKELLEVESRRRKVEARLKALRGESGFEETSAHEPSESEISATVEGHPEVVGLYSRLIEYERNLASAKAYQKKVARRPTSDPALTRLVNEVEALRNSLDDKRREVRPVIVAALREGGVQGDGGDVSLARRELAEIEYLERHLNEQLSGLAESNQDLSANTLGIQEIQDEIAQYSATAEKIGAEVEALKVELAAPPRVRSIEDAPVPSSKDDKKRKMMTLMAAIGAFAASIAGFTFLELRCQTIDHVETVQSDVGLSIVGALPKLPSRARGEVVRVKDRLWHARLLESIEATRTMLVHAASARSHRVVMIASAMPNEGKTSLASHLATSLARSGLKTLLIDADLRNASIHKLFDLPPDPGLSDLLRGEATPEEVTVEGAVSGLHLIVAGQSDPAAIRALARGGLTELFDRFRTEYDFVIVDSSPILPVADAHLVAQQVDAVLFSIFRDVSRRTQVIAAVERLSRLGVELLGAVVTGAEGVVGEYAYYGRYGESEFGDASESREDQS